MCPVEAKMVTIKLCLSSLGKESLLLEVLQMFPPSPPVTPSSSLASSPGLHCTFVCGFLNGEIILGYLSGWALNEMPCIFIAGGRRRFEHTYGRKKCKEQDRELIMHSLKIGKMQSQWRNAGGHKKKLEESKLPQSPSRHPSPADTLISAQWNGFWTSRTVRKWTCWFKPPKLW